MAAGPAVPPWGRRSDAALRATAGRSGGLIRTLAAATVGIIVAARVCPLL